VGNSYHVNYGDTNDTSTATIYGIVFNDINSNGFQDGNETGLSVANISLDGTGNIITNTSGVFSFITDVTGTHHK